MNALNFISMNDNNDNLTDNFLIKFLFSRSENERSTTLNR